MAAETWLLLAVAPALWWLVAMVGAVMDVRERAVPKTEWDGSPEETSL